MFRLKSELRFLHRTSGEMVRQPQWKPVDDCIVLYVEDDDAFAYLFQFALRETTFSPTVFRVTDGEQAIAFVSQAGPYASAPKPDLVLLDLNLPRRSGFDVLAAIRRSPELALVPVIVFSTSMFTSDRERAFELGASDYITKPSDFDRLVEIAVSICKTLGAGPQRKTA